MPTVVWISALGFFVDVYDILIFSAVRVPSLVAMSVKPEDWMQTGIALLNIQLIGMLLGGVFWGVLGDRKGRVSVLFGSIAMYSASNVMNAFAPNLWVYGLCRFLAGFGLAGELGAGVTLASESLPAADRVKGPMLVTIMGALGGIFAGWVGAHLSWQQAYLLGGSMGILLLLLRVGVHESKLFSSQTSTPSERGSLRLLWTSKKLRLTYARAVATGLPLWICTLVIAPIAPEISQALGSPYPASAAYAMLSLNLGLCVGNTSMSYASLKLRSRKEIMAACTVFLCLFVFVWGTAGHRAAFPTLVTAYGPYVMLGIGCGYFPVYMTWTAESLGTNLRATATTSLPNIIRGCLVIIGATISALAPMLGLMRMVIGAILCASILAWLSIYFSEETAERDLFFES